MMPSPIVIVLLGIVALAPVSALAQASDRRVSQTVRSEPPRALVEAIELRGADVQAMQLLREGLEILLGAEGRVALSYLSSCVLERIAGGRVRIGRDQSTVTEGRVERETVACTPPAINVTAAERTQAGGATARNLPEAEEGVVTVRGAAPLLAFADGPPGGPLAIVRLDDPRDRREFRIDGAHVDLSQQGVALVLGAIYEASVAGKSVRFRVMDGAAPSSRLSRLIVF